jgi:hypothetical protein
MVATLHLVIETLAVDRWTLGRWLGVLAQAALVLFVLHIRFSAAWQLVCVGLALAVRILIRVPLPALCRAAIPTLLLGVGVLVLRAYQKAAVEPGYAEVGGARHVFWHSVYTGLAFNPDVAREQKLRTDDWSIYWATSRFLHERGRDAEWQAMGGTRLRQPDETTLQFEKYDRVVREMFLTLASERPGAVLASVLYYKPVAWTGCVGWLLGLGGCPDPTRLWLGAAEELHEMDRRMHVDGCFVKPWRWECLAVLGLLACWAGGALIACRWWLLGVAGLFTSCSLLPVLLGYPTPHTIEDGLIALLMMTGVATALCAVNVARRFVVGWVWIRPASLTSVSPN